MLVVWIKAENNILCQRGCCLSLRLPSSSGLWCVCGMNSETALSRGCFIVTHTTGFPKVKVKAKVKMKRVRETGYKGSQTGTTATPPAYLNIPKHHLWTLCGWLNWFNWNCLPVCRHYHVSCSSCKHHIMIYWWCYYKVFCFPSSPFSLSLCFRRYKALSLTHLCPQVFGMTL